MNRRVSHLILKVRCSSNLIFKSLILYQQIWSIMKSKLSNIKFWQQFYPQTFTGMVWHFSNLLTWRVRYSSLPLKQSIYMYYVRDKILSCKFKAFNQEQPELTLFAMAKKQSFLTSKKSQCVLKLRQSGT